MLSAIRLPDETRRCLVLGFAGSTALAGGGLAAGALPVRDTLAPALGLGELRQHQGIGLVCAYFGLALLVAAWWRLGGAVRGGDPPAPRGLLLVLAAWALPLVAMPPLFSRDVYSYLAQGAMVTAGLDVYEAGPAAMGGPLPAEVPAIWQHTPTPYGPAFLSLAAGVSGFAATDVPLGVFGMRAVALAGIVLLIVCLPRLALACGVDPAAALWLGALNPLVLLHLVSGAHNDAVMLGLLIAGLTAAAASRFALATVAVTLACLVKAPAALGLVVVVWLWQHSLRQPSGPRPSPVEPSRPPNRPSSPSAPAEPPPGRPAFGRRTATLRALALTAGLAAATTALVTAVTGTGYGWVRSLSTPISAHNWSLSSTVGRITRNLLEAAGSDLAASAIPAWRWTGLVAAAAATLLAWHHRRRLGLVYALGLSLAALALLGPALRPWYLLWGLVPIAAAAPPNGRVRRWTALACLALTVTVFPSGFTPSADELAAAVAGALLAVPVVFLFTSDIVPAAVRPYRGTEPAAW
ncbi:polyprenol phosphomannose-dependent alpha 1,6 mannosyltransferase MptB [Catellatospora sichuanensis]|uniref:polyprenol phosphomannose-dependent alpha 1,6 mannosyltransferase MptB n=1 Tax=Catellatospora sichuanensis TaxID=1969805 RepID=UPI001C919BAC|nr:polyprenol phosphomannose-dependent alpha 1,6 mannosyltransferase MptB [Catellatospora sichuanensis]